MDTLVFSNKSSGFPHTGLGFGGNYRNERTTGISLAFERYRAVYQGEQGMVFAHSYVHAGVVSGTSLAYDDIAGGYGLTAEDFNAQAFAF